MKSANLTAGVTAKLPTQYGVFDISAFETDRDQPTLLISMGKLAGSVPPLIRVHSECFTGDVLGSQRCDCGPQLQAALQRISEAGRGAVIYLRQEGRGIGLVNKLRAYQLQERGLDTVEANQALHLPVDARDYHLAAQILQSVGVTAVNLLTNNPNKVDQLTQAGITIARRVPLEITPNEYDRSYLATKKHKLHHYLSEVD